MELTSDKDLEGVNKLPVTSKDCANSSLEDWEEEKGIADFDSPKDPYPR